MTALPAARTPPAYRVAVVCLGNICRSPIGAVVLERRLARAGLGDRVEVSSFGTGGWHVGEPMDARSAEVLARSGHDPSRHRARQVTTAHAGRFDLLLAMDATNADDLRSLLPEDADRVLLFRELDPEGVGDVGDPYYGGAEGFDATLAVVERTADALVAQLARTLEPVA